jgi:hypothetical protein
MFDNLIRRDPNDGAKTIIPDLAHSWEIAPDHRRRRARSGLDGGEHGARLGPIGD